MKILKVYLQPQVRCEDGLVKGAEALVRWEHRKLGLIPPGDFIEFFEQNGLITELDNVCVGESMPDS